MPAQEYKLKTLELGSRATKGMRALYSNKFKYNILSLSKLLGVGWLIAPDFSYLYFGKRKWEIHRCGNLYFLKVGKVSGEGDEAAYTVENVEHVRSGHLLAKDKHTRDSCSMHRLRAKSHLKRVPSILAAKTDGEIVATDLVGPIEAGNA